MLTEPAVDVFVDKNSPLIISNQHLSILRVAVTLCDKTHSIPFGVYGTKVRIGPREADGEELAMRLVKAGVRRFLFQRRPIRFVTLALGRFFFGQGLLELIGLSRARIRS